MPGQGTILTCPHCWISGWIYQSWALHEADSGMSPAASGLDRALSRLHGFSSAVPPGNFILLDMSHNAGRERREALADCGSDGGGMWRDPWNGTWGLPFIWTALPEYGGNQGLHGNISEINSIPFAAPPLAPVPQGFDPRTQAVGVGDSYPMPTYSRHSAAFIPKSVRWPEARPCGRVKLGP